MHTSHGLVEAAYFHEVKDIITPSCELVKIEKQKLWKNIEE